MKKNKKPIESTPAEKRKLKYALGIIIAAFAFLLYAQSFSYNYACDDISIIPENNLVKQGFAAIPTLLTTDRLFGTNDQNERMPEYRPIPMVVFASVWQFFPNNPHAYHFINVFLYSVLCLLIFLLLSKLFKNRNLILPFICTLLYVAHPIHTEVVDNIKSLDEILCFLFALLSSYLFIRFTGKKSVLIFVFASICYFFSLLSKETGIVFFIIIPLILFLCSEKINYKKILIITLVLAVVTAIFLLIRFKVLESFPKGKMEILNSSYYNPLIAAPDFISQKATAFYYMLRYVFLLIFPYKLSYDYSFSEIPIQQIFSPGALISILLYLLLGIYAIIKIWKKDIIAFAILFYLLTLVPISNIFFLIHWSMSERFLFMPSLGFSILLAFLLIKITKTENFKSEFKNVSQLIKMNSGLFILLFVIIGIYSFKTISRNPDWKDSNTLFSHDVKVVPNSARAHFNYGNVLFYSLYADETGKAKQKDLLNDAAKEYTKATAIYPDFPIAYYSLGGVYERMGDFKNAILNYETAIQRFQTIPPSKLFCDLGLLYCNIQKYDNAISILDSSLKYYPNNTDAYIKKSFVYLSEEKNTEAIAECDKLLKIDSNNIYAYINKGCGYINLKLYDKGILTLNKGHKINPYNAECMRLLGVSYMNLGDSVKANQYFEKVYSIINK